MLAFGLAMTFSRPIHGATRTWTGLGATNNWTDAANWSGAIVPGSADVANFDASSSKDATINAAISVAGISVGPGYGGTITRSAAVGLTVGATGWTQGGGTFVGGTAAMTVNGPFSLTGGAFAATAGTLSISGNLTDAGGTFLHGGGTVALTGGAATIDVVSSEAFNNLRLSAGAKTVASGDTLTVGGTLTLTAGSLNTGTVAAQGPISQASTYGAGTGTVLVNGTAAQTFTGAATATAGNLPRLVIDKPSGTLSLAGTIRSGNGWTYTAGTLDPGTSTVVLAGGTVTGSHALNNVDLRATTTIAAGTTLTVGGTLTLSAGSLNTGSVAAQGPISQAPTSGGGTASLLVNGSANQTLTGTATATTGLLPRLVIDKPSGTLSLAGTIRSGNGWTYTAGTLDPGTSTVVLAGGTVTGSHALNNVDLRATTTIAAGTTLTVGGTLTLSAGSLNTGSVAAQGPISQAPTSGGGTASLLVNGSANQTLTGTATATTGLLPRLVIDKPSGTLSLAGTIRSGNGWTYTAGTLDPGTSTVVLAGGTVTGSHALNNVDLRATTTIAAGTTLTVGGTLTLTAGSLNTGSVAAQGPISQASTYGAGTGTVLVNGTAAQTFTGAATATAGNLPRLVIDKPSGTLSLAGTIRSGNGWTYTAGTLDPGTSTVVLAGGTVTGSHALNNVDLRATTTIAAGTTLTVGGTLTLTAGSLNTGTVAAQGPISQASTYGAGTGTVLVNGTAAQTFTGAATATAGNLPRLVIDKPSGTLSLAGTIRSGNGWTYTAGTLDPGTSTVVLAGGTVRSLGMTFFDVVTNGGTTTLGTAMTVGHDLAINAGTLTTSAGNHALSVGGDLRIDGTLRGNASALDVQGDVTGAGAFVAGTSRLTLDGSSGQILGGPAAFGFHNLVVNDALGVVMAGNVAVANILTLSSGELNVGPHTLTIRNVIGGTATNLVADGSSSLVVNGTAAGIELPSSVTQLNGLTVANANGLALMGNVTVRGTLTLTNGPVNTGAFVLTIDPTGTVVRVAGRVAGRLEKHVPLGAGMSVTYEVGDATRYAPVSVVFGNVTVAGRVTVRTTPGDHPDVANSGIVSYGSVNRYWTMTNVGLVFDTYDATFTFTAADLDGGVDPTVLVVAKLDGASWTLPPVVTRTATSVQAGGMTSFSDFAVGEPTPDLAVSVDDGTTDVTAGDGLTRTYTITVTNEGPSDATAVGLIDGWPTGFSRGSIGPSQGSCGPSGGGQDFSCDLGSIAAGASATVSVSYTVPATTESGPQTMTVEVTSATSDPDPTDDVALDTTTVAELAELVVAKDDGLATVVAGSAGASYTITITNHGPSDADSLVVDDIVPAVLTVAAPSTDLDGDCSASVGNVIHCALPASLAVGATWTVRVPYDVPSDVAAQTVTNSATATSAEDMFGVTANDMTDVTTSADLAVSVDDGTTDVTAGDGLTRTYTITVTNEGPSDATAVGLIDGWPTGFSRGSIGPSQGSCGPSGGGQDFSCDLGSIAAGASATVSVSYTVPATTESGPQTMTVEVTSATSDPDPTDDVALDTTTVADAPEPGPTPTFAPSPAPTASLLPRVSPPDTATAPFEGSSAPVGLVAALLVAASAGACLDLRKRRRVTGQMRHDGRI